MSSAPKALAAKARLLEAVELSVVIPVLDERDALPSLLAEVEEICTGTGRPWEVIVVDDGSTDGTWEVLEDLAGQQPQLRLVRLRRNFGKSAALRAGFEQTRGDVVVTIDGDGQDDPAEIPGLVARLDQGYDVVSGWKQNRQDPVMKRYPSRLFNRLTARVTGVPLHDVNCGLKAYRGRAVRDLEIYGEQHRLIPVLGFQRGWRVTELPVNHRPRVHGRSKFGFERYARGLLDLLGVVFIGRYQHRPLHLFGGVGLIAFMAGLLLCAYLTLEKLTGEAIGGRPLLILGVLLIIAGIQLFTLGLVGEMVAATRQDIIGSRSSEQLVEEKVGWPDVGGPADHLG